MISNKHMSDDNTSKGYLAQLIIIKSKTHN